MNGVLAVGSRCLPDEIMSEIFINCLEPDEIGCITPSSSAPPLLLSWVCRHWRQICLSTPQLWTGIILQDLTADGLFTLDRSDLFRLLDLWIARSGSCPISVKFAFTDLSVDEGGRMVLFLPEETENNAYLNDMRSFISKLLTCQHRWRALHMTVLDLSLVEPLLRAISVNPASPLLEHLSIATQYLGIFGEIRTCNLALSSQLRTIRILSPLIVPEAHGVRLDNLTELELKYCSSMAGCLQWLDKAPNLQTLKVRFFASEVIELGRETRVRRLERLKTLQISSYSSDSDPGPFLDLLDLPALTELYVDTNDIIDAQRWTCIEDLLVRSRPPAFQALTLLGMPMTSEEVIAVLRITPKITHLSLGAITDDVLLALSASTAKYPRSEDPVCPLLESMEIGDVENCSVASLVNFAQSRTRVTTTDSESLELEAFTSLSSRTNGPFRTLETLIMPHDPDYAFISHPDIAECLEMGLNVEHRAPIFEILPPSRVAAHLRQL